MDTLNLYRIDDIILFPFWECNNNCRHCSVNKPIGAIGYLKSPVSAFERHISKEHVERIAEWQPKKVTILGGEPFLSSALPDIIKVLKKEPETIKAVRKKIAKLSEMYKPLFNLNTKIVVYTNGILLADASMKELRPVLEQIDYLTISLEGDKYWTEYVRGKIFDKCMKVLEKVREITNPVVRMSYWYEVHTVLDDGKIVEKFQMADVLNMTAYFDSLDIPVVVSPLFPSPDAVVKLGYQPIPREVHRWFFEEFSKFKNGVNLLPSYKAFLGKPEPCTAGVRRIAVDPEGNITACQWDSEYIGHLDQKDELIEERAYDWRLRRGLFEEECMWCKYREVCQSSCRIAMDYKMCPVMQREETETTTLNVDVGVPKSKVRLGKVSAASPAVC